MAYNLATQAKLQAEKDICAELEKEGKTYIRISLKSLNSLCELDFLPSYSRTLARGKNGKYTPAKRLNLWTF